MSNNTQPITEHAKLSEAYAFFNARLFGGKLPPCMITLHRKSNARGYYAPDRWQARKDADTRADELSLNPDTFGSRDDRSILSTLVHEMAHHWQFHFGEPSRNGYHNKSWGNKMKQIGLCPSSTGEPGGKETGQKVSHYILPGGPFDEACTELLAGGFSIDWQSEGIDGTRAAKRASKTKYTCPECGQNAWAKPNARIGCLDCMAPMLPELPDDEGDDEGDAA